MSKFVPDGMSLPKGMELPEPAQYVPVRLSGGNYIEQICTALDGIEDYAIEVVRSEILEEEGADPVVSLVLRITGGDV